MPFTSSTFLPPLLNPVTGREIMFLYTPNTSLSALPLRPKYGTQELGEILTQQYPPIFHAATNVPAFIRALTHMPNLRHLTITCSGQDPSHRYRRDAVDYALISLRIAVERAPMLFLEKLTLDNIHPAGLLYLRHMPSIGCSPAAGRRWNQVKKLSIRVQAWDMHGRDPGLDHLKILEAYVRTFAHGLEKLSIGWVGRKGPFPLTLGAHALFAPPRKTGKLFGEVTSPMSPLPARPQREAIVFPTLRHLRVQDMEMTEQQVANLIHHHRHSVREFDFKDVVLSDGGSWHEALAPLTRMSGSDAWSSQKTSSGGDSCKSCHERVDVMDTAPAMDCETVMCKVPRTSVVVTKRRRRKVHRKRRHDEESTSKPGPEMVVAPLRSQRQPLIELLQPLVLLPPVQGVQRNIQQDNLLQELADDVDRRVSTLRKAKEVVLAKLNTQFCKRADRKGDIRELLKNSPLSKSRIWGGPRDRSELCPILFSRY